MFRLNPNPISGLPDIQGNWRREGVKSTRGLAGSLLRISLWVVAPN